MKMMKFLLPLAAVFASAGPADAAGIKTLILGDDVNLAAVLADLTGSDNRFDHAASSTYSLPETGAAPTASYLAGFDSVLVFTNYQSVNFTALSDLLGDYVDQGGGVVISTFWGQEAGSSGGKLNSTGYNPLNNPTVEAYDAQTLGVYDASDPLFAGVSNLSSVYYNGDYLAGLDTGATLAGSWASGKPLAAYNANRNVAAIGLFPNVAQYGHADGDYAQLFANALALTAGTAASVPEPATWGLMIVGFGMVGATMRRRATNVRTTLSLG